MSSILELPDEVLETIFFFCSPRHILLMTQVCKHWHRFTQTFLLCLTPFRVIEGSVLWRRWIETNGTTKEKQAVGNTFDGRQIRKLFERSFLRNESWENGFCLATRFVTGLDKVVGLCFQKDSGGDATRTLAVANHQQVSIFDVSDDVSYRMKAAIAAPVDTSLHDREIRRRMAFVQARLVMPTELGSVTLFNVVSKRAVREYRNPKAASRVNAVSFEPFSTDVIVTGHTDPGFVTVFDTATGTVLRTLSTGSHVYSARV